MACPTCHREDVQETCGSKLGSECQCCGMTIIATADPLPSEEVSEQEPEGDSA